MERSRGFSGLSTKSSPRSRGGGFAEARGPIDLAVGDSRSGLSGERTRLLFPVYAPLPRELRRPVRSSEIEVLSIDVASAASRAAVVDLIWSLPSRTGQFLPRAPMTSVDLRRQPWSHMRRTC